MSLEMKHYFEGDVVVVTANGDINSATARDFGKALQQGVTDAPESHVVLDMSGVYYMSSAGLRDIVAGLKAAKRSGGDLRFAGVQRRLQPVFEMVGLDTMAQFFENVDDAIASYDEMTG